MRGYFWGSMVIACMALGPATAISPYAGMIVGSFVAVYTASLLFFADHPVVWWYHLLFFALLVSTVLVGAGVFASVCAVLPFTGIVTRACRSLGFGDALRLHIWVLCLIGGILWLSMHFWIWWKLRQRS